MTGRYRFIARFYYKEERELYVYDLGPTAAAPADDAWK